MKRKILALENALRKIANITEVLEGGNSEDEECLTPGAIFHMHLKGNEVGVVVSLPFELNISSEEMDLLDDKMHDAMEKILSKYFKEGAK